MSWSETIHGPPYPRTAAFEGLTIATDEIVVRRRAELSGYIPRGSRRFAVDLEVEQVGVVCNSLRSVP
jgi:hypothetical protein